MNIHATPSAPCANTPVPQFLRDLRLQGKHGRRFFLSEPPGFLLPAATPSCHHRSGQGAPTPPWSPATWCQGPAGPSTVRCH